MMLLADLDATTTVSDSTTRAFKVQHMRWRIQAPQHPKHKFRLSGDDSMRSMCDMDPIYDKRASRMDVVFRPGDIRSTLDDRLMEKASEVRKSVLLVQELMNAVPHYFLVAGVDEERNFVRGRKRSDPSAYVDIIDYDDTGESHGALIKCIAQAKAHLLCKECTQPDWSMYPPLDPLVATVMEWAHSMDDEQWAQVKDAADGR
ncbi:hypothetical protein AK812_SmicGene34183 [Symbiodinium microadriaticum]|uniref:Uncharacterized protein n=1 Tax=Symbiodinium microadriaticum TaxID=2951 RepID=A0A1Q9CPM4_SYMMI|nr:hypothetical protein AK812_SmicGene34183 [Symbiodinium microadriaticum]CAE7944699.1 unnamed protein product [Symbiodinium sp. KB8]